jgi:hypothetical protein
MVHIYRGQSGGKPAWCIRCPACRTELCVPDGSLARGIDPVGVAWEGYDRHMQQEHGGGAP